MMTDDQLSALLRKWNIQAPDSLEGRVFSQQSARRLGWWRFLLRGYIRVPVPLVCCVSLLMIGTVWRLSTRPPAPCAMASVTAVQQVPAAEAALKPADTCPANTRC